MRVAAGQLHLLGDLIEGGLDPVAPLGDDLPQGHRNWSNALQPADPLAGLAQVRQRREQAASVASDLAQEGGLAAAAQQVPRHGDDQQLGVAARWRRVRSARDRDGPVLIVSSAGV
jgi:hypothetical protein